MAKRKKKNNASYKKQAWGALILILSLLLTISIISFDVNDPVYLTVEEVRLSIHNWLGPLGAVISYNLMQWTLGYSIIGIFLIFTAIAIQIIRSKPIANIQRVILYLFLWSILISIYLAFPEALEQNGVMIEYYPSGLIGGVIAEMAVLYLGNIGSILIISTISVIFIIITLRIELATIAGGVHHIFNAIIHFIAELISKIATRFIDLKNKPRNTALDANETLLGRQKEDQTKIDDAHNASGKTPPLINLSGRGDGAFFQNDMELASKQEEEELPPNLALQPHNEATEATVDNIDTDDANSEEQADFEIEDEVVEKELDYDDLVKESVAKYHFPSIDILNDSPVQTGGVSREELQANADLLEAKLLDFGVKAEVKKVSAGPVITMYELKPATGVKVSSIVSLANDLALAMEARGIRIIAPIPGVAAVGIEIPNRHPQMVYLKSLIRAEKFNAAGYELPLAIGKTINGESFIADLAKMPHLLIAGATGSGKSVGINTIIMSLLYSVNPGKVKFVMVDPKKLELSIYKNLREHYLIWRPDLDEEVITKPNNAVSMLNSMVMEMEKRYDKLASLNVRNIIEYNKKVSAGGNKIKEGKHQQLPYIVTLVDELADLMMVAAKEVEAPIARLAQMARAVGIHLIVATQRPSVDVITGMIKANFPARIAYQVASKVDSRTVIDMNGAEQLLGNGDMLYLPAGFPKPVRLQNPFVSTEEVEAVIDHISRQYKLPYYSIPQPASSTSGNTETGEIGNERDPLYNDARAIVVQNQQGSISFLQRRLKIGYSRAARLMDELEEDGVVGTADGSKAREVLITLQELQNMI
jgi:S-DNA-T family DNA segregation ATPase FtsK/SpoIIIE